MRKGIVYILITLLSLSCLSFALIPRASSQTVETQNVKILGYSYYIDNEGLLDVIGQIQNVGNTTINQVVLTGALMADNEEITDSVTQAFVNYLLPQQKAPFYMEFSPPSSLNGDWESVVTASDFAIDLNVVSANATNNYQYQGLTITTATGSVGTVASGDDGQLAGAYMVNGIVKNTGNQPAENITIVGTFFNSTGNVIATGYTDYLTPMVLDPGDIANFMVAAFDLNQTIVPTSLQITSYELLVQTQLPILNSTTPPTPQADVTGTTGSSSSSSTSSNSNSGSSSTSTQGANTHSKGIGVSTELVITIVAVVVVALAVAYGAVSFNKARERRHMTRAEARRASKAKKDS